MKAEIRNEHYKLIYSEYDRMVKAKSYKTGKGTMYQACVKELLIWLDNNGITTVSQITGRNLFDYLNEYLVKRPNKRRGGTLSVASINHHLFSIQLLFDHLLETDHISEVVTLPGYLPRTDNHYALLSEEEIKLLYKNCENKIERALLSAAYGCGLRRGEIENLNTADIIYQKGVLVVTNGKGNKVRDVPLNDVVQEDLKTYYMTERLDRIRSSKTRIDAFFLNLKGERMSGDYLNKILKEIVRRTANTELINKNVSLHCLRHSITTHLVDRGMGIEPLRKFLGHSEIDTTSLYMSRRKHKNKFII
jgi:integrase/recombinase XerD